MTPPAAARHGGIRPLRREDLPAVAQLRAAAFRYQEHPGADDLAAYMDRIFLRNPWVDPAMPSLVYEDDAGAVAGFVGVVPRPMVYRGRPIRAAVATQFVVAPKHRGLVGRRLVRAFLDGPQDLSLSDTANNAARTIWESLHCGTSLVHSLTWTWPVRPWRHALARRASSPARRAATWLGRVPAALADGVTARMPAGPGRRPPGELEPLDAAAMLAHPECYERHTLRPAYDRASLEWLIDRAREKRQFGTLEGRLVRGPNGAAGWFFLYVNPGGESQVVQIAARPSGQSLVFAHLRHFAWRHGVVALTGRVQPELLPDLAAPEFVLRRQGAWMSVHARELELVLAVERGDAFVSRLEGEWWLSF